MRDSGLAKGGGLQTTDGPLNAFYAFLALGGIALSAWFLRHCREQATRRA